MRTRDETRAGRWRRTARAAVLVAMLVPSVLTVPVLWAERSAAHHVARDVSSVPVRPVAIVLGAGLDADGRPSPMLAARVDAAVDLYRQGTVTHLLMSGDNGRADYDEPTAMRRRALDAGVPASAVTLDYAGFSTFDSCARARAVFGVRSAVVVTQEFHVTRAVALCRAEGIDAFGLALSTSQWDPGDIRLLEARDRVATAKAFVDEVLGASPRFLGEAVGLPGSVAMPELNAATDARLVAARSGR